MKESDLYRKFWQSGLHDERLAYDDQPAIIWQLFYSEGEEQALEFIDESDDAEMNLCVKVEAFLKNNQKSKFSLLVLSTHSPLRETCDYAVERFADKLVSFHWCFVALRHIKRPSCDFHIDSYHHRVSPDISGENIKGLKVLAAAKVQLSTFKIETWAYLRGFLKLSCILPNCLGRSYDKTFGHKVYFLKKSLVFKFSRQEEDNNMADDLTHVLTKPIA